MDTEAKPGVRRRRGMTRDEQHGAVRLRTVIPQPPPYPTASSGFIIQHLLPGDEVGIASREEVGCTPPQLEARLLSGCSLSTRESGTGPKLPL